MRQEVAPKLISGIGKWELFPGVFIIGDAERDRYMRVPAASLEPVWRAVLFFDGQRSFSEIAALMLAGGWQLDVRALYRKLADAGLIAGSEYASDLDRASFTWGELSIKGLFPPAAWPRFIAHLATTVMFLSVAAAGLILYLAPIRVADMWNASRLALVIAILAGAAFSILIHESAHALAACAEGLRPSRLRFLGYLGFIPYVLLTIPGIYTVPPASRIRIWLAGPLGSLSLASFCYLASGVASLPANSQVWLSHMSVANTLIALWNCCPLLPTDGYFIASTLLKQANWRVRCWRELSSCVLQRRRPQLFLLLYALGSSLGLAYLVLRNIEHILIATSFSWIGYAAVMLIALMFLFKQVALKRRRSTESMEVI